MLDDGATILAFPGVFCNPTVVPPRVIWKMALPAMADACREIRGPVVMHHGGVRLAPFLEDYAELPNVAGFVVDARDSLSEAREKLGGMPLLLGNLDGPTLNEQTPDQLQAPCEGILADRAQDPHFILSTSGADVPWTTPPELIQVVCHTVQQSRKESI